MRVDDVAQQASGGQRRPMLKRRSLLLGLGAGAAVFSTGFFALRQQRIQHEEELSQTAFNHGEAIRYGVASPNGEWRAEQLFDAAGGASPRWEVLRRGQSVLAPGSLGLVLADGRLLGIGAEVIGQQLNPVDEEIWPHSGAGAELAVQLLDSATGILFDIILRAYDSGVALRYLVRYVPEADQIALSGEATQFRLVTGQQDTWVSQLSADVDNTGGGRSFSLDIPAFTPWRMLMIRERSFPPSQE